VAFRLAGLAVLAIALAGCDGRLPSPSAALDRLIAGKVAVQDDKQGTSKPACTTGPCEVMDAFEEAYPDAYADFRLVYNQQRRKLGNDDRAWRIASPYLEQAIAEKVLQASDEDIRALLDLTLERMAQPKVAASPQACVKLGRDPAMTYAVDSEQLQDKHARLLAKIMRTPAPGDELAVASAEETLAWITAFAKSHRENVEGLLIARRAVLSAKQAKLVCDYAKAQWAYLRDEPDGRIGALFRGVRGMAEADPMGAAIKANRIQVVAPKPAAPAEAPAEKP
jgi:hypothetical protein